MHLPCRAPRCRCDSALGPAAILSSRLPRRSQRILRDRQRLAVVDRGQVSVIARHGHIQCVDHVDRRFATADDRVDEVVTQIAMRAAVSTRPNSWRQSAFLRLQTLLDSLVVPFFARRGSVFRARCAINRDLPLLLSHCWFRENFPLNVASFRRYDDVRFFARDSHLHGPALPGPGDFDVTVRRVE